MFQIADARVFSDAYESIGHEPGDKAVYLSPCRRVLFGHPSELPAGWASLDWRELSAVELDQERIEVTRRRATFPYAGKEGQIVPFPEGGAYNWADVPDTYAPQGLGVFAKRTDKHGTVWYYRGPRRPWVPILWADVPGWKASGDEPPPLPKPNPRRATCYDGPHTCGSCGEEYWIELHGNADGYCTFCYYQG